MGDETLYPVAKDYSVRSLGVYVTEMVPNRKPITDKQVIYIFNAVVIPMLEYSLNDMTLSEKECLKITTKFISMIKNKALLPITAPNALIHAKEAYDVCHLWDRQLQMQSNNLFNRLNDKGMLGCSTRVRLQHLQNSFWSGQSITESLFTMKTKRGWGNITIEEMLDDESQYRLIRKSLRNRQLMFLEQLVSHNGKILLHWQEITNNDRRGPKPGWFKTLENKLLTDIKTQVLSAEMQATLGERYNICNWNIGKQSNNINWVAIQNDEGTHTLIGKKRKMLNKDEFTIQHHTKEVSSQSSGNSVLEKCTGCAQGDRSLVTNFKNQDTRLRLSQNTIRDGIGKIIEDSLPVDSIRSIDPPTVYISNNARDRTIMFAKFQNFWTQENIQTNLDDIRLKLSSSMSIRIYTDGSLIKKDNNNSHVTTMGCGWCAFDENNTEFHFSGKVENFASSTRAELMAILTAVYATPKRSRLCIFADSQAAIDAIAKAAANPRKAHRKLKNWTIVKAIEEVANIQNLTLRLEKVKAHSGVIHNETADKLAREEDSLPVDSIRSIDPPTVYISNNARDRTIMFAKFQNFWTQENIQTNLDDIRLKLSSSMSIRIYTDGSLIKKDNNNSHVTTMGCGWCAFDENNTEFHFSGKVENFASSTRAELMAILTAVYATPKRSRLCIFADSQAAIDAIAKAAANPRKAHRKLKNWTIVKAIEEVANIQNLTLRLEKVKAHSGVIHNETADKLAREGCFKPVCFPDLQSLTSVNAVSCWNTETIEEPLRHFTKKLGKAKHSIKWRLLNRNISTISAFKSKQIQWESSWRMTMLSYIDRNVTDNKETWQRAFNVKLFNNELPTLEKLKDRFPKIYENDSCIRCNLEKENQTTTVACGDTCKNMCKTLEVLKEFHIPRDVSTRDADHLSFIDVMLGLIPITVYDIVLQKVVTHELADQIVDDVFNQFKLFLHTHIWKDRCTVVKKWETENGISNNKWKKKVRNETLDTTVTFQTNNTDNNSVLNNTTQDSYIIMLSKIAVIGLGCIK
ncbi:hypothetical protein Glove_655g2 [Diversispora epigaea]|uniref:ribonuclease H n=1 Tax=Diversispora epigaea TaxID=1348612 RepID=A0A397GA11_9GLOM|nr:hypothetical protein Glove_655g2 [Diversispora epigaea]